MAKQKKKRNKVSQWWFDHKRIARPVVITVLIAIVVIFIIVELVHVLSGHI